MSDNQNPISYPLAWSEEIDQRVSALVADMTIDEKAALSAGSAMFALAGVPRLGIAPWPVTDGPNGARGSSMLGTGEAVALCIPCGSGLGATWDVELVETLGAALGHETRTKQSKVLLAPTVNLHRSPLAGRNFECFSEDPLLSGKLAAAYVRGVQSQGVATTVKHLVGNEAETNRYTTDSVIDQRTLRELYLVPFELAVTEGKTLGIMTSYNRLNGRFVTEDRELLTAVVRDEWGFDGIFITDWFGALHTVDSAHAGLDIEMPGGGPGFGPQLADAVREGSVSPDNLDGIARRVLTVLARLGALDGQPASEFNEIKAEHRRLARDAAVAATVLLKNEAGHHDHPILPLDLGQISSIAVIGPNAERAQIMGGGSAALRAQYRMAPIDAIRAAVEQIAPGSVTVTYSPGASIDRSAQPLMGSMLSGPDGSAEPILEIIDGAPGHGPVIKTTSLDQTKIIFSDPPIPATSGGNASEPAGSPKVFGARLVGQYQPPRSGVHHLELTQVEHTETRVMIDGETLIDSYGQSLARTTAFFGSGTETLKASVELDAANSYRIEIEMTAPVVNFTGLELGVRLPLPDDAVQHAVNQAANADVAVVVVGTNDDWESEGHDRTTLDLPGDQDALIQAVAQANPNTVVVINTGAPVTVPWVDQVPAVIQSWFGGQAMAEALADVLLGRADPGGRLPVSFPLRLEHNPSHGNFPGDGGTVSYAEGLFVGYRWYENRHLDVAFPFGHGLSYTSFDIGCPILNTTEIRPGEQIQVTVPVTNTGHRAGTQVVQCYVAPGRSMVERPPQELKAFQKVRLEPGETTTVVLTLDNRAFAYWNQPDPGWSEMLERYEQNFRRFNPPTVNTKPGWVVDAGPYDVVIATSSAEPVASATVNAPAEFMVG